MKRFVDIEYKHANEVRKTSEEKYKKLARHQKYSTEFRSLIASHTMNSKTAIRVFLLIFIASKVNFLLKVIRFVKLNGKPCYFRLQNPIFWKAMLKVI
jgi:hypothetical protein